MLIGGVEYLTTGEICRRLRAKGVSPDTVRGWRRARLLLPMLGPDGRPVRVPTGGRGGGEYVYAWPQAVEVELATRDVGRPRGSLGEAETGRAPLGQHDVYR